MTESPSFSEMKGRLAEIRRRLLTGRQRQVVRVLANRIPGGVTYPQAARILRMSLGTLHTHLRRIRTRDPAIYSALMQLRQLQLADRHTEALEREAARSRRWHRRQANRRYYYRFGYWPWERRQYRGSLRRMFRGA